jgi:hypothetical protein
VRYVAMSPNILKVLLRAFLFGLTSIAVLALSAQTSDLKASPQTSDHSAIPHALLSPISWPSASKARQVGRITR